MNQTIVFIVDELDRCLPEYSIKVLERLHHLFNAIANVQVVIAVDKKQLKHTICQIYGSDTDPVKYLAKFIDFELKLAEGSLSTQEAFELRFTDYINRFVNENRVTHKWEASDFARMILEGINIRSRIAIIEKCKLLHDLLNTKEAIDSTYMCIELALAVIKFNNIDADKLRMLTNRRGIEAYSQGLSMLRNKWSEFDVFQMNQRYRYVSANTIWGAVFAACRWIAGEKNDDIQNCLIDSNKLRKYSLDYWILMDTII